MRLVSPIRVLEYFFYPEALLSYRVGMQPGMVWCDRMLLRLCVLLYRLSDRRSETLVQADTYVMF
jgi:hypothetical protein